MKILVTGTAGQLAQSLLEAGIAAGVHVVAMKRPQLDLTRPGTLRTAIADAKPDFVVNAAAYTAVDKAESEEAEAHKVNAKGAGDLAELCHQVGAPLIHISTDYVFDGSKPTPYVETDPTAPINAYGRSKLAGELAVRTACPRHVILRTSWVYSPFGSNFVRTMLRLALERTELSVVNDQLGAPTYAPHLASAILDIVDKLHTAGPADDRWGLYHATGSGETSWHGFAAAIFDIARSKGHAVPSLRAIPAAQYPTPARRPASSRLDCGKLADAFRHRLPHWQTGMEACLARLLA